MATYQTTIEVIRSVVIPALLLLWSSIAADAQFTYPDIPSTGSTYADFVPMGWVVRDSTVGDLNKDGAADAALVLQSNNVVDTIGARARMLLILFADSVSGGYRLTERSNTFILVHNDPNMEDPYSGLRIRNGVLTIEISLFMNAGGWESSNVVYRFRFQNAAMTLIGADENTLRRNTGEVVERSYNFLTRKVKVSSWNAQDDKKTVQWRTIDLNELKTLKSLERALSWEVETGVWL